MRSSEAKVSVYEAITAKIVAAIEAGAGSCVMPWHGPSIPVAMPINAVSSMPYHGINIVALWAQAASKGYVTGYWATYQQWRKLNAQVRSGEKGSLIVFYKKLEAPEPAKPEDDAEPPRIVLRLSHVFNADQVDGWEFPGPKPPPEIEVNAQVAAFMQATGAKIVRGNMACYRRGLDHIEMPPLERFIDSPTRPAAEAYNAVLLHEAIHWVGAPHRLNRAFGAKFGDRAYAFEEIVAELGSAFLCSAFRIANEPRADHAAYISSWLDILERDHRAIFKAAHLAQEAVEYLRALASSNMPG